MDRKILLLVTSLSLLLCSVIRAQNPVDSLTELLGREHNDTLRIQIYQELYGLLRFDDREKAVDYLNQSLELSTELNDPVGLINSYLAKGEYYETSSLYDSALLAYEKAQSIALQAENNEGIKETLIGFGSVYTVIQELAKADSVAYLCIDLAEKEPVDSARLIQTYTILSNTAYFRSQYEKSIEYDLKSLSYNQKDYGKRAKSFLNIGSTHDILGKYSKANDYYMQALEMATLAKNDRLIALTHYELGTILINQNQFEEAKEQYELAMGHFEKVDDKAMISHVHFSLGKIHVELQQLDRAIERFDIALQVSSEINLERMMADLQYYLGLTYYKKKQFANAERFLLRAKSSFDLLETATMQSTVLAALSDLYHAKGDYKQAYNYLSEVKTFDDSTHAANEEVKISEIEEQYQNEQKQQKIDLLSAENEIASLQLQKQENLRNYLILATFLLVLLIGVIYSRYQFKARANAKLKELDTLKTNFFTNISHEFRTPLTLILSPVQKLLQHTADHQTKNLLGVVHRNATQLTQLTNQLLDLSKLEAGKLKLHVSAGNFKAFIKVLCASFESLAAAQKVDFITEIDEAPEEAFFDEDKVQKILNNLLSNAFKFTSPRGSVTIKIAVDNQNVHITVKDTGKGISASDQQLIFRRFHQSSSNESNAAGTGVGLTLSKELAVLHQGDIVVESKEGHGSTFTFYFPVHKSAYAAQQIEDSVEKVLDIPSQATAVFEEPATELNPSEKIVLIVEDNPDLRNHIKSLLSDEYTIAESINGKVGIDDAIKIVPDLIITDLMMPEADGVELCNTLKANEKTSHIPIIMLTAKADRDTKLDGLKTGADDFLTKPFDNEELAVRVQNVIKQRETLQSKYIQTIRLEPSKVDITSPDETFIRKALEVVDHQLSNSEFTVEAFQKEMGMSRMQLHRKLKALTNYSASEFIRDIRLQRAADLLETNGMNVGEVAYSCGFNSVSYFTQCFSEKYGVSPTKYVKKAS